jgi:hypothetical protein
LVAGQRLIKPGDRYEIAHSFLRPASADLAVNLPWYRNLWTWLWVVVTVVTGFVFALQLLPENEQERKEARDGDLWYDWVDPI